MSEAAYTAILWSVIAWPFLLAFPAIHSRLPLPRHLAVIPAVILVVTPGEFSLELPDILLGTGFSIDNNSRWILAMSVIIWLMAATVTEIRKVSMNSDRNTMLFLLTLAANLGIVLTNDLVGFFCFSTIMGYGFYGLMAGNVNTSNTRAGYSYLIVFIIADLLLFEALLLAALMSEGLQFNAVREALTETPYRHTYLWLTLIGFALKTGIWPAHLWLTNSFRSANPLTLLLLAGVPVSMALFGLIRWLPLGEHEFYLPGRTMQLIGIATLVYTLPAFFKRASARIISSRITMVATSLIFSVLGTGLSNPSLWRQYESFIYPLLALLSVSLTMFGLVVCQRTEIFRSPGRELLLTDKLSLLIKTWGQSKRIFLQSFWQLSVMPFLKKPSFITCHKSMDFMHSWSARITIFVLFGLIVAWLAK